MSIWPSLATGLLLMGAECVALAQSSQVGSSQQSVQFQYQLHYPRPWIGIPGPGLSLGGTISGYGREGMSSWYGVPFPAPLGAGVYVNNPDFYGDEAVQPQPFYFPAPYFEPDSAHRGKSAPKRLSWTSPDLQKKVMPISASTETPNQEEVSSVPAEAPLSRGLGDSLMLKREWNLACKAYREAVDDEPDCVDHRARLAIALACSGNYLQSVDEFKAAILLDSDAISSNRCSDMFATGTNDVRRSVRAKIAQWSRTKLVDADRLFLLGVWLSVEGDPRSDQLMFAAARLDPTAEHLRRFLTKAITARETNPYP